MRESLVLVTGSLEGGGAERVLSDMANYWTRKGLNVTYATWAGPEVVDFFPLDAGVRRVWLDVPLRGLACFRQLRANLRRVRKLRDLLKVTKPVAVLSFIHTSNVLSILAAWGLTTRVVVSERMQPDVDPSVSGVWKLLRRIVYRWSDFVVVQSRDAARWVERNCSGQAVVIPNPLRSLPTITNQRLPLVIAVGRLSHQKGFDLLLRAFAGVANEFPEWNLAIIGHGAEHENLARLCAELDLAGRVEFAGQVREVESWMSRAGLVVQPSRFEGFPNAVLEAMGMGAPVISANCPSGPADMIDDGINGRLVPVDDVATLTQVMAELMSQPAIRESLGREARKVRQKYGQEAIMAKWETCLMGEPTAARADA